MAQQGTIGRVGTKVTHDPDGTVSVRYWGTPVVTVYPGGAIDLDTGGHYTATTKTRMNQASCQLGLGFSVYQKNFAWYVNVDGQTLEFTGRRLRIRNGRDYGNGNNA